MHADVRLQSIFVRWTCILAVCCVLRPGGRLRWWLWNQNETFAGVLLSSFFALAHAVKVSFPLVSAS
jgi:hypothetical protein